MRVFGFVVTLALLCLLAKNVFGETPKPITLDIEPRVQATDPYNQKTFRVRIRIPTNKNNRLLKYTASCGDEIKSSDYEIDHITYQWYEELTVIENCIFQACLLRIVPGKTELQPTCVYQEVTTDAFEPDPIPF